MCNQPVSLALGCIGLYQMPWQFLGHSSRVSAGTWPCEAAPGLVVLSIVLGRALGQEQMEGAVAGGVAGAALGLTLLSPNSQKKPPVTTAIVRFAAALHKAGGRAGLRAGADTAPSPHTALAQLPPLRTGSVHPWLGRGHKSPNITGCCQRAAAEGWAVWGERGRVAFSCNTLGKQTQPAQIG